MTLKKTILLSIAFLLLACGKNNAQISKGDQDFLREISKKYLADPLHKKRVKLNCHIPNCWGGEDVEMRYGWQDEKTSLIYFIYGDAIKPQRSDTIIPVNFLDSCRKVYALTKKKSEEEEERDFSCYSAAGGSHVVLAAWLLALGENELAEKALDKAKKEAARYRNEEEIDVQKQFREWTMKNVEDNVAWDNFSGMVHHYMVRKDSIALQYGLRLNKMVSNNPYPQTNVIIADLQRRKKEGTFGKTPDSIPPGFNTWAQDKKIDFLIRALEDIDARQWGQPGGVSFEYHWVGQQLLKIGEPAVPKLIDVIASDNRLTRSVHFFRDFAHDRTVLGVYEVALSMVMTILQTEVFTPRSTGDSFSSHGLEERKAVADELRTYWKKYGAMPYDERLMKVIADTTSDVEKVQEAVENISNLQQRNYKGTTVFVNFFPKADTNVVDVVKKYSNPTVAEAIVKAFDRNLRLHKDEHDGLYDYRKRQIENKYLYALIDIGDKRIAKEMSRRYRAETDYRMMRKYAIVAFWLGDTLPVLDYAAKVEKGELAIPSYGTMGEYNSEDEPSSVELREIIYQLAATGLPACDRALYAIATPEHRYHKSWEKGLNDVVGSMDYEVRPWLAHVTSIHFIVELARTAPDEKARRAIRTLSESLYGFPEVNMYTQFFSIDTAQQFLNQYHHFRLMTAGEMGRTSSDQHIYMPDIKTGDHVATADDVREGRAIFHLDGKGTAVAMKLPAVATEINKKDSLRVLILQAEQDEKGNVFYGVIKEHELVKLPAAKLTKITPIEK